MFRILVLHLLLNGYLIAKGSDTPQLRLVIILVRHGDRTLIKHFESYPNDEYANVTFPEGDGALIQKGEIRAYHFGLFLAETYAAYLSPYSNKTVVKSFTSSQKRTKITLQRVLAGLLWRTKLQVQTLDIEETKDLDPAILFCPEYKTELDKIRNLTEIVDRRKRLEPFMNFLTNSTGKSITDMCDIFFIYSSYMTKYHLNLPGSPWLQDVGVQKQLLSGSLMCYDQWNYTKKARKLNAGTLIKRIIELMIQASRKKLPHELKFIIYSGHDVNIVGLLNILKIQLAETPLFTSAVIFELYEYRDKYYIKILYNRGIPIHLTEKEIPFCNRFCELERFLFLLKTEIPREHEVCKPLK